MNRLFTIQVDSLELRGLISPGELPDVILLFYGLAEKNRACPSYLQDGVFHAVKGEVVVRLIIGPYHQAIPSKMLCDLLEEVMCQAFK